MQTKFQQIFESDYQFEYFSPGRVNIIGEHIDYNGGLVLPMAINFGTYGYLKLRSDKTVRLYSENFPEIGIISFDIDILENNPQDDWANYVKAVIYVFKQAGYQIPTGFDLYVNGTIPNGSGLSSSASLEVLVGQILIDNFNFDIDGTQLALLAQKAENDFIGVNCGIMDQFIIANGSERGALLINCDSLEYSVVEFDLKEYQIVVLNSNKKRGLVDSEYNERRQSCERVLAIAQSQFAINELCELELEQLNQLELSPQLFKRAKHAVSENLRVKAAVEALSTGDVQAAGLLLQASHQSLRNDFEVSCEQLDFIVDSLHRHGAIGARMTGAGFGGCVVAIVNQETVDKIAEIATDYYQKFNLNLEHYIVQANNKVGKI